MGHKIIKREFFQLVSWGLIREVLTAARVGEQRAGANSGNEGRVPDSARLSEDVRNNKPCYKPLAKSDSRRVQDKTQSSSSGEKKTF